MAFIEMSSAPLLHRHGTCWEQTGPKISELIWEDTACRKSAWFCKLHRCTKVKPVKDSVNVKFAFHDLTRRQGNTGSAFLFPKGMFG